MHTDFSEAMARRSDKQLAEILTTKRHEYQEAALAAAQAELEKRNLNVNDYITPEALHNAEREQLPADKKDQKLHWGYKILTFAIPGLVTRLMLFALKSNPGLSFLAVLIIPITIVIQVLIFKKLKENDYQRMALDFKMWGLNCWIFYVAVFVLSLLLKFFSS